MTFKCDSEENSYEGGTTSETYIALQHHRVVGLCTFPKELSWRPQTGAKVDVLKPANLGIEEGEANCKPSTWRGTNRRDMEGIYGMWLSFFFIITSFKN